jgi:two-component system KDP operon response regulator KdpE
MPNQQRVLIVEDDPSIRRLLRAALDRADYMVIEAATGREALAAVDIDKPDAVLLDLGLPDRDGLELIQLVKTKGEIVLLVVSARTDTAEKVAALDLGADDYLTKPFDTEEVLARIRTALRHRRRGAAEPERIEIGDIVIDLARRRVLRGGLPVHLTPKEYEVLAALARQPDRVVGHVQLLREIWGPAHERHVEYLRIVVRALRQKLENDAARPRLIINEPGVGYRLREAHV